MKKNYLSYLLFLAIVLTHSCKSAPEKKPTNQTKAKAASIEKVESKNVIETKSTSAASNALEDFIPKNYFLLESVKSAMNNQNQQHVALICAPNNEKNPEEFSQTNRRIIMLLQSGDSFTELSSNDNLILCKSCGGVFGDPYNGVELKNNILKISNYGGSAWRWSENYTFRFQNNEWQLIGATYDSYYNAKECPDGVGSAGRQLEDINFASGRMQILHTKNTNCEPYEDYWKYFGKKNLISLTNFPGSPAQWPNGKIKDGDGKD